VSAVARAEIAVPVGPERAFAAFAELGSWWPSEFSWSGEALVSLGLEPRAGGLATEIGPHGFRVDWGRVLDWQPPERLVLAWQIGPTRVPEPDPARASEVEVRFAPAGPESTRVSVEHRYFERHGDGAEEYAAGMTGGWETLLERYAASLRRA
jgi:uncharacterized protein YndB with AHSA1/START domain